MRYVINWRYRGWLLVSMIYLSPDSKNNLTPQSVVTLRSGIHYVRFTVFVKKVTFLRLFPLSTLLVPLTNSIIKVGCHYLVNRLSSFEYDEGESSWPSCVGVCFDIYAFNFTKGSKMVSQFLWNNKYNKCTNGKLNFHLFPRYAKRQPLPLMFKDHAILAITYRKTH